MKTLEVYRDKNLDFRWRLRARNNRVVADSGQGYSNRANALKGARVATWYHVRPDVRVRYAEGA